METMSEEEAFALDKRYTNNPPKVDPAKARIRVPLARANTATAEYSAIKATISQDEPEEIPG